VLRVSYWAILVVAQMSAAVYFQPALAQKSLRDELKLAPPEGSSVERLGDSMLVNGRPMAIDHVVVSRSPAEVLRHYRKVMDERDSGKIVERKLMGDQILARKIGADFVTVRVRPAPGGSSDVWIMTTPMQPPSAQSALPPHLVLPAGSRILSNVETVDSGRRAHTIIATAEAAVSATQDFLTRSLGERGFSLVTSDASRQDPSKRVLLFQRGTEDVMITIADGPAGRTLVLNASGPK
jgi:hypothetical protein